MELSDPSEWYWTTSYHRGLRASIKRLEEFYKEQNEAQKKSSGSTPKAPSKPTNKSSGASFKPSRNMRKTMR